jgi:hypothetical protein
MAVNLLAKLHELTHEDRDIIAEAMRRYDPKSRIDYTDLAVIALLDRERGCPRFC